MKKILRWLNKNRYNLATLGLGGAYFWFLTFIHDVAEGDWAIFVKRPVDISYGIDRWFNWSSRLLIENACNFFSKHLTLWTLITIITGAVLFWSIGRILNHKRIYQSVILFSVFLTVNLSILSTAGVFATTINYLWPLACFAFVVAGVLRPFESKRMRQVFSVAMVPLFIFAVCSEQIAMLGVFFFAGCVIYYKLNRKKIPKKIWLLLALSILGVVNALVSPGNAHRTELEANNQWSEFSALSLKKKIVIGVVATMSRLFFAPQLPIVLLVLLIGVTAIKWKNIQAFASILPSVILLYLFNFSETFSTVIVNENHFKTLKTAALGFNQFNLPESHQMRIYFVIFAVLIISVLLSILFLYGRSRKMVIIVTSLLGGGAVSLAVSLSPTLFASSTRTLYPLLIIVVGIVTMMLNEILVDKPRLADGKKPQRRRV